MKAQGLALGLLLTGCNNFHKTQSACTPDNWMCSVNWGSDKIKIYGIPSVNNAADKAIDWWNSRGYALVRTSSIGEAQVAIAVQPTKDFGLDAFAAPSWLSEDECKLRLVEITVDPSAVDDKEVIAHEIGHALGLNHSNEKGSIMNCHISCELDDCKI